MAEQHPGAELYSKIPLEALQQFTESYMAWYVHHNGKVLDEKLALLTADLKQSSDLEEMYRPSANELAALEKLQERGVTDTDLLDRLMERGEDWLTLKIKLLEHFEANSLRASDDHQWFEQAVNGAFDWIDVEKLVNTPGMALALASTSNKPVGVSVLPQTDIPSQADNPGGTGLDEATSLPQTESSERDEQEAGSAVSETETGNLLPMPETTISPASDLQSTHKSWVELAGADLPAPLDDIAIPAELPGMGGSVLLPVSSDQTAEPLFPETGAGEPASSHLFAPLQSNAVPLFSDHASQVEEPITRFKSSPVLGEGDTSDQPIASADLNQSGNFDHEQAIDTPSLASLSHFATHPQKEGEAAVEETHKAAPSGEVGSSLEPLAPAESLSLVEPFTSTAEEQLKPAGNSHAEPVDTSLAGEAAKQELQEAAPAREEQNGPATRVTSVEQSSSPPEAKESKTNPVISTNESSVVAKQPARPVPTILVLSLLFIVGVVGLILYLQYLQHH